MRDSDLISKLNNLREIKPDATWQANSRAVLLTQISRGGVVTPTHWFSFMESTMLQRFFLELTRPVSMAMVILLALLGGSYASVRAANQTTPGNPLYIAKIISERTQLALTFDNTKKAKLNLEFAANRVEELQKVSTGNDVKPAEVAELTNDFRAQIEEVKARVAKMPVQESQRATEQDSKRAKEQNSTAKPDNSVKAKVESASATRTANGIDYYDPRAEMIANLEKQFEEKKYDQSAVTLQNLKENIDKPVATTTVDKKPLLEKATSTVELVE